jgi:2-polyprenyl-3-methyl-5-hydroxy-6-metoxy-1,4-benzoquinol methylase
MRHAAQFVVRALRAVGLVRAVDLQAGRHAAVLTEVERLGIQEHAKVLDVGCGEGRLLAGLRARGFDDLHGCDWAGDGPAGVQFTAIDLSQDHIADVYGRQSVDLILCSDVIEHLHDPAGLLQDIASCLRHDGTAVVSFPNCASVFERIFFLATGNSSRYQPTRYGPHGHISMLPSWVFTHLAAEAGLTIERLTGDLVALAGSQVPWLPSTPRWSYSIVATLRHAPTTASRRTP